MCLPFRRDEGSSPLTRGARSSRRPRDLRGGLIPAHAGSTFIDGSKIKLHEAHPRSRGEHVGSSGSRGRESGSSPLTRGAPKDGHEIPERLRLIPAHAGSTDGLDAVPDCCEAHPRSRGEHTLMMTLVIGLFGSSPLTRGARLRVQSLRKRGRLIPAHAGSTKTSTTCPSSTAAHPRSRGEHHLPQRQVLSPLGSSPLTRGALLLDGLRFLRIRLIPAHAGSTRLMRARPHRLRAHPRSRGEHISGAAELFSHAGSSPLTRGAPCRWGAPACRVRLIPAHAGSTPLMKSRPLRRTAHPRSRGEHVQINNYAGPSMGSSPLTRGALRPSAAPQRTPGLIPAHAGSTHGPLPVVRGRPAHPRSRGEHPNQRKTH